MRLVAVPLDVLCECARELCEQRPMTAKESAVRRRLESLSARYPAQPVKVRHEMRDVIARHRAEGVAAALALLDSDGEPHALKFLAEMLLSESYLAEFLCDPKCSTAYLALRTARRMAHADPNFVQKVTTRLTAGTPGDVITRALTLLEAVAPANEVCARVLPLLNHSNARIRSKAVRIISKVEGHGDWWQRAFEDRDPRVRANVIETLWEVRTRAARAHFTRASKDPHHRVRSAALVGLYLSGDSEAASELETLAAHRSEDFRAAAAWAMGTTGDPRFLELLKEMRKDTSVVVRRSALQALVRIRRLGA